MKVVHLSYVSVPGFTDPSLWLRRLDFFVALVDQMALKMEVISIHCINYEGVLRQNGVTYYFFKNNKLDTLFPLRIHSKIKALNPDIILVHGLGFSWQLVLLHRTMKKSCRIFVQHHAEKPFKYFKSALQRIADKHVTGYFFPTKEQARPWVAQKQISTLEKVKEVMEVPSIFYFIERSKAREVSKVQGNKIYLWVGRFESNKDPLTLIKGFAKYLIAKPNARLYVIYQQDDLLEEVNQLVQDLAVHEQILLVGKVDHGDMGYWFNSADFIISTSHYEGSGVSVVEAMSCGCIPILTTIPSFVSMRREGSLALYFTAGDPDDLCRSLLRSDEINIPLIRESVMRHCEETCSAVAISDKMNSAFLCLQR